MDGGPDSQMPSSAAENECSTSHQSCWIQEQDQLKANLVLHDDFSWTFPSKMPDTIESSTISSLEQGGPCLQYIGGVDLSFSKVNPSVALGALIVLDVNTLQVVYEDFDEVQLTMPYIPGFLAFRESPVLLGLLEKMARTNKALYPQLLMVDGNGILHPRGFGLASHLGVLADIPAIGVGKNLHLVDGLTDAEVRLQTSNSNVVPLVGKSGKVWGVALKGHESGKRPIFVSIGHRISLETATNVVLRCCRYRIPEPVRQADIRSRERMRSRELEFA